MLDLTPLVNFRYNQLQFHQRLLAGASLSVLRVLIASEMPPCL